METLPLTPRLTTSVNPKANKLVIPRAKTPGNQMAILLGTPRATTPVTPKTSQIPRDINILLPGIDISYPLSNYSMFSSSNIVTSDRLTPKPKVFLKIIKVHNSDKKVPGLKPSNVSEEKKDFVSHIRKVPRSDNETKVNLKIIKCTCKRIR